MQGQQERAWQNKPKPRSHQEKGAKIKIKMFVLNKPWLLSPVCI